MSFLFGSSKPKIIPEFTGLQVNTSVQVLPIPIIFGGPRLNLNLIYYNGFNSQLVNASGSSGGGGKGILSGGKGSNNKQVEYFATIILALGEGIVSGVQVIYQDQAVYTPADYPTNGAFLFAGDDFQAPWSYVVGHWPNDARGYKDTSYYAFPNAQLDSSATVPQISVVPLGARYGTCPLNSSTLTITTGNFDPNTGNPISFIGNILLGTIDCDPMLAITDVLAHSRFGAGFPLRFLDFSPGGNLVSGGNAFIAGVGDAALSTYCQAVGFGYSTVLNNVESSSSILDRWCKNLVVAPCWTGELLKFIPYWDSYENANPGWVPLDPSNPALVNPYDIQPKYFQPNVTPIVTLTFDHILQAENKEDDPITVARNDPMEVYNTVRVDYKDRTNFFNDNVAEAKDEANIELIGPRVDNIGLADEFTLGIYAQQSANMQLRRNQAIRRTFSWRMGPLWAVFDQMDIVLIPDPTNYATSVAVRIISMEDDEHEITTYTAEEFPAGGQSPTSLPIPPTTPPNMGPTNLGPGDVNAPIIFEPTSAMVTAQALSVPQIILGATSVLFNSLNPNWGGTFIWVSTDGITYERMGQLNRPATMGALALTLGAPVTGNPDLSNTLTVDMSMSGTLLPSVLDSVAAVGKNLCIVQDIDGWELLSYATATLVGPNAFTFALTDLYRGLYGTTARQFGAGSQFMFVDTAGNFFEAPMPLQFVGFDLYIKLQSYNVYNGAVEDLAVAPVFRYTVTGGGPNPPPPHPAKALSTRHRFAQAEGEQEQRRVSQRFITTSLPALPQITGVTLDNAFFPGGQPSGTFVGNITVNTIGGTFSGTLALSGTDAASFQISAAVLETNGTVTNGSYSINIVPTQAGFIGSGTPFPFTITGGNALLDAGGVPVRTAGGGYVPVL